MAPIVNVYRTVHTIPLSTPPWSLGIPVDGQICYAQLNSDSLGSWTQMPITYSVLLTQTWTLTVNHPLADWPGNSNVTMYFGLPNWDKGTLYVG